MLGSKSLPSTSVLQVSLTVSEMSRSSVRPIMSLISNLRSLSSRLSWVVAEEDAQCVLDPVCSWTSFTCFSPWVFQHTYPVHAPKAAEPPLRCSLRVQLPARRQTLPPGPEMIQSWNDWMDLRRRMNKWKQTQGEKVRQLFSQLQLTEQLWPRDL